MGIGEYLQEEMKSEKGQMKNRLWNWGQAVERCLWKEEDLQRLKEMHQVRYRMIKEEKGIGKKEKLQKLEEEYVRQMQEIREELNKIISEKKWMDEKIGKLDRDEEMFLRMRFEKGYGFDFIAIKMHLSRATLFRMQDRILKKLMDEKS